MIKLTKEVLSDPVFFQRWYLKQIPHKKQEEVLLSPVKHKIVSCGRRSGKTQMIAGEIIRGAICLGMKRQMVIAPYSKQSKIVFDKIIELLNKSGKLSDVKSIVKSPYPKITFVNGSIIDFGSADNPNSLRGEAYERIFIDEAGFIKEGSMSSIRPLTFDVGAPMWLTSTPWGDTGFFYDSYQRGLKGEEGYGHFHYNYKDNPYITDEGKKEIEKEIKEFGIDNLYVRTEIFGEFVSSVDKFFKDELINNSIEEYNMIVV